MRSSPKLKPGFWDGVVGVAVLLAAVLSAVWIWSPGQTESGTLCVVVTIEGEEKDRFSPEETGVRTYQHNGYTLRVASEDGQVFVAEADCPTQDCVHTGAIDHAGQSIVCLPARIVIQLERVGGRGENDVDLAIG